MSHIEPSVDVEPVQVNKATGLARAIESLRVSPGFRFLWLSNLFFFGGAWTQTLILGWMVFDSTGSELLLGVFTAIRLAPMLLGPIAGAVADRYDRIRVLFTAGSWAFAVVAIVASMASAGHTPYWLLVAGGLAIGLAQSPSQPARMSLVLELVGRRNLSNANALNSMAMNMTKVIGPALGGAMISSLGAPTALWISGVWFAISIGLLWPLRNIRSAARVQHEPILGMIRGGMRAVLANQVSATVLLITLVANFLVWPIFDSFMPVYAKDVLKLDASGLGWLLTCAGLGGLVGSIIIAAIGDFQFKGALFLFGTALWGALWAVFGLSESVTLSFLLMGSIGLASAAFGVLQTTLMLMTTEPSMQGRALGIMGLAIGVQPISSLTLGLFAQHAGIGPTTFVCGTLLVIIVLTLAKIAPETRRYSEA